ncbi:hypothetical protein ACFQ1S_37340, partial [Kibdelosporangium lantanae]
AAEGIDIKEGTVNGVVKGNTLDGTGESGLAEQAAAQVTRSRAEVSRFIGVSVNQRPFAGSCRPR